MTEPACEVSALPSDAGCLTSDIDCTSRRSAEPTLLGMNLTEDGAWTEEQKLYWLALGTLVVMAVLARNLVRSRVGRAFAAVRDRDVAAGGDARPHVRIERRPLVVDQFLGIFKAAPALRFAPERGKSGFGGRCADPRHVAAIDQVQVDALRRLRHPHQRIVCEVSLHHAPARDGAVEAVVGKVGGPADAPLRPWRALRQVHELVEGTEEPQVVELHHGAPE